MSEKIAWEKHPVSPERKAELRAQGYKIVDARFKPTDAVDPEPENPAIDVKASLAAAGVKFDARWKKDKLAALWAAFQHWGMDAETWNNLSADDVAARMAEVD